MVCICLWTLYTQLRFITADIVIVINSLSPWHFYCIYMCMNFVHSCVWQLFLKNKRWDEMSMLQKLQLMNKKLSYCRATMQAIGEWSLGSCKVVGIIASRWATRDFLLVWYCNYLCLVTWSWIAPCCDILSSLHCDAHPSFSANPPYRSLSFFSSRIHCMDFPDCLLLLLSISVFFTL